MFQTPLPIPIRNSVVGEMLFSRFWGVDLQPFPLKNKPDYTCLGKEKMLALIYYYLLYR